MVDTRFMDSFTANAWHYLGLDNDYLLFTAEFMANYTGIVRAEVITLPEKLSLCGHFGVYSLSLQSYECEMPYYTDDLEDMIQLIILAEENLLRLGIPFIPDYSFHGHEIEEKKKRNWELRALWGLDDSEFSYKEAIKANKESGK